MTALLLTAVKVAVILGLALAAAAALRRRSAALRHWVLAMGVACALAMPLIGLVAPGWSIARPATAGRAAGVETEFDMRRVALLPPAASEVRPAAGRRHPPSGDIDLAAIAVGVWLAGVVVMGFLLLAGLLRLHHLKEAAVPFVDERWTAPGVRLLQSDHPALVMTWGVRAPVIILPAGARTWPDERIRVVLGHELAHIERGDWIVLLLAHVMRTLHWYNPLAWIACRRLRQESKHACDDAVLGLGVAPAAYAAHLLDLARASAARTREWAPALPIARPSGLERRVHAMLNANVNRRPATVFSRAAAAVAFLIVAVAAAGLGAAQGFATVAGTLLDAQRAVLPGATVTISNAASETKTTTRTNREGRFELVGLPPGAYVLDVALPGFRPYRAEMTLSGEHIDTDIVMRVGTLQETITVSSGPDTRPAHVLGPEQIETYRKRRDATVAACTAAAAPAPSAGRPVGGNIRPPVKLRDSRPLYPAALRDANVGGEVRLAATIGTDGTVREMTPESGHPDLVKSAMDAVGQWQFDQTLLNCVPIEVEMQVRVNFRPEP